MNSNMRGQFPEPKPSVYSLYLNPSLPPLTVNTPNPMKTHTEIKRCDNSPKKKNNFTEDKELCRSNLSPSKRKYTKRASLLVSPSPINPSPGAISCSPANVSPSPISPSPASPSPASPSPASPSPASLSPASPSPVSDRPSPSSPYHSSIPPISLMSPPNTSLTFTPFQPPTLP
jgi:hypothetical protein